MTIFGEMSRLLVRDGHVDAAIRLEQLWSELTRSLPYFTVCSYPTSVFRDAPRADLWAVLCAEHSAVCHAARLQ
jgi:hypothetical protein